MLPSLNWFILTAALTALAWTIGVTMGRGSAMRGRLTLACGMMLLVAWAWLMRHQDVAVQIIPAWVLSRIEGVAAAPIFMLVIGVAWSRAKLTRQKHVVAWAVLVCGLYFIKGGWWMIQAPPVLGATQSYGQGIVLQSEDYSCVPAACATALNTLGVRTTEAEMAEYTETRPGSGSTMVRAMAGLERRLKHTPYHVQLVAAGADQLDTLPMPALTPLQFEHTRRHMVTILSVSAKTVSYADPVDGVTTLSRAEFEQYFIGRVLVFRRR